MADILFTITDAGRVALVNAANTGTNAVLIASAGLSATAVVPNAAMTALPGEFKRVASLSGDTVADDIIHLIIRDESADAFSVRSIALYLDDGTLFGLYGQAAVILEKTTQSLMLLGVDVKFANVDATTITFGDANFLNPPATTDRMGVAELATLAETIAGLDVARVPAAKMVKDAVTAWLDARFGTGNSGIWHPGNDGAGSGLDADLLDGQQGSYYTNITVRLGYTPVQQGTGVGQLTNSVKMGWSGTRLKATVDNSDLGNLVFDNHITDVWRASNDGAGSGLDADLLDGQQGSYYTNIVARLGYAPLNKAGDTASGRMTFAGNGTGNSGLANALGGLGELEVRGNGVGGAFVAFHRPGAYAAYLGLETDNTLRFGGWSLGSAHLLWHSGNDGNGSGLDADLVDGWHRDSIRDWNNLLNKPWNWSGQAGQPQWVWGGNGGGDQYYVWNPSNFSVNYANSAGNAYLLDGYHADAFDRIVGQNLSSNGGYIIYASGRKETWGVITIGQDAYATYNLPCAHASWVHPTFGLSSSGGNTQIQQNTGITSINGAPPASVTFWNADDRTVTIWVRTTGV